MQEDPFETFWRAYPRRIGKGAARSKFQQALRKTTLEVMLAALEAYKRHKPPERDWCHASTWLSQERWLDEWDEPQQRPLEYYDGLGRKQ